jgi:primosomal protein N' (replication factor Y)
MNYYEVSPVGIVRQDSASFTYASEEPLAIGTIVRIEIGKKEKNGVVIATVKQPSYATKNITHTIETTPLPKELVTLASWLGSYYGTHLGVVWQTLLPRGVDKKRRNRQPAVYEPLRDRTHFVLNTTQQSALRQIETMSPGSAILHGVTGSGKTAVYIEAAKRAVENGKSVIVLTPEIGLTSQLVDDFSQHFNDILLTHSRQTEAERHTTWQRALTADTPHIAIGPRSALFMPLSDIGLIIIDEAHEPSYKQEQSPRYSALRAASILAKEHTAKLILGSATPLVTDYYTALQAKRPIITMPETARTTTPPVISLIDMTKRDTFKRHRFLSDTLLDSLEATFAAGNQALIFHNRRGSSSITLCDNCGWQAGCPRCFIPLTLHADTHELRCHICGLTDRVPTSCPSCGDANIIHKGIGTKLIEAELRKLFPDKTIVRFDGDSDDATSIQANYKALYSGEIDLIIGTQVVAKGLDLPHLRTVGIVQADAGLGLPDYSSSERTFQLLAQAIGRVGRSEHQTSVVVQSYQPTHPAVTIGLAQDYAGFYDYALRERRRADFPPYTFLLKLTCVYKTEAAAVRNARTLARDLRAKLPPSIELLGPTPAFYERQHDTYRWQLTLKSSNRSSLIDVLTYVPTTHWQYELDPISLL